MGSGTTSEDRHSFEAYKQNSSWMPDVHNWLEQAFEFPTWKNPFKCRDLHFLCCLSFHLEKNILFIIWCLLWCGFFFSSNFHHSFSVVCMKNFMLLVSLFMKLYQIISSTMCRRELIFERNAIKQFFIMPEIADNKFPKERKNTEITRRQHK